MSHLPNLLSRLEKQYQGILTHPSYIIYFSLCVIYSNLVAYLGGEDTSTKVWQRNCTKLLLTVAERFFRRKGHEM